jgi:hypothetical protein
MMVVEAGSRLGLAERTVGGEKPGCSENYFENKRKHNPKMMIIM